MVLRTIKSSIETKGIYKNEKVKKMTLKKINKLHHYPNITQ